MEHNKLQSFVLHLYSVFLYIKAEILMNKKLISPRLEIIKIRSFFNIIVLIK